MLENERGPVPLYQERHRHLLIPLGDHGCDMQKQESCWEGLAPRAWEGGVWFWSYVQLKPLGVFIHSFKNCSLPLTALGADAKETHELCSHRA